MKRRDFRTDEPGMNGLPDWAWVLSGVLTLAFLLGVAHVLASLVRNATRVHQLKQRVAYLRLEHQSIRRAVDRGENPADLPTDPAGLAAYLRGELSLTAENLPGDAGGRADRSLGEAGEAPDQPERLAA